MRLVRCSSMGDRICSSPAGATYIGREMRGLSASVLANEHKLKDFPRPELCLRAYRFDLLTKLVDCHEPTVLALARLTDESVLACWCVERSAFVDGAGSPAPERPCHGDVIASVLANVGERLRLDTMASVYDDDGENPPGLGPWWYERPPGGGRRVPGMQIDGWRSAVAAKGRDAAFLEIACWSFGPVEAKALIEMDKEACRRCA